MARQVGFTIFATFVSVLGTGCGELPGEGGEPSVGAVTSAVQTSLDKPPSAAAVQVKFGNANRLWVFACDSESRLRFFIQEDGGPIQQQNILDTTCLGPLAVAKWDHPPDAEHALAYSTVKVYGIYNDLHIWELGFPASTDSTSHWWEDITNLTGGDWLKRDLLIVADTSPDGDVSLLARNLNGELFTFDHFDGAWSKRPVLFASGGTMTTSNQVTAQTSASGASLLAGRGFDANTDGQGWIARRTGSWSNSYVNYRGLNNAGTLVGTPSLGNGRVYVTVASSGGNILKFRSATALSNAAWTTFSTASCRFASSPVASPNSTMPTFFNVYGYGVDPTGNKIAWDDTTLSCSVVHASSQMAKSAPAWVVTEPNVAQPGPFAGDSIWASFNWSLNYGHWSPRNAMSYQITLK